jgi:hypothetical protein
MADSLDEAKAAFGASLISPPWLIEPPFLLRYMRHSTARPRRGMRTARCAFDHALTQLVRHLLSSLRIPLRAEGRHRLVEGGR